MKSVFLFTVFLTMHTANAQNLSWAKQIGGPLNTQGKDIVTDADGNVYTTGYLNGTADLDPGPGVFNLTQDSGGGAYISKLAANGNFVWAKQFAGWRVESFAIALDAGGNVYTSGFFEQIADFDPGPGVYDLKGSDTKFMGAHGFICKLDNNGNFVWAKQMGGGDYSYLRSLDLKIDGGGNVIATGYFIGTDTSSQPTLTTNATGLFWVTVTNSNNCSGTDSVRINAINPLPVNFLKTADSVCSNEKLNLQPINNYDNYQWSNGVTQKSITVQAPGEYWLKVIDANGCMGADTISVLAKNCSSGVFIPNAFSPNGDGRNDLFKATVHGDLISFKLEVYDRAGQLIFQSTTPFQGWNGLFKGNSYSTTIFVWQCLYQLKRDQPRFQKGTVTLIR